MSGTPVPFLRIASVIQGGARSMTVRSNSITRPPSIRACPDSDAPVTQKNHTISSASTTTTAVAPKLHGMPRRSSHSTAG